MCLSCEDSVKKNYYENQNELDASELDIHELDLEDDSNTVCFSDQWILEPNKFIFNNSWIEESEIEIPLHVNLSIEGDRTLSMVVCKNLNETFVYDKIDMNLYNHENGEIIYDYFLTRSSEGNCTEKISLVLEENINLFSLRIISPYECFGQWDNICSQHVSCGYCWISEPIRLINSCQAKEN